VTRLTALAVFWAAGLLVGFFAVLSAAAKFSCARTARGLACRPAGTVLAVGLVIAVIVIVAVVTALAHDSRAHRRLIVLVAGGVVALGVCFLGAQALLGTA
jgi:hypothetical protein